jgi:hypothetical protein
MHESKPQDSGHHHGVGAFLKKEVRELIPPTIFFMISFALLLLTQALVLKDYGVDLFDIGQAVIGALIVGKVLLIVNAFPFVDRYPARPLIWNTLWKALVYNIAAILVRYLEAVIGLWIDHGSFGAANDALFAGIHWPHFWLVQLWLAVLFLIYCAGGELSRAIGREKLIALFFGPRSAGE